MEMSLWLYGLYAKFQYRVSDWHCRRAMNARRRAINAEQKARQRSMW